jgi:MAE_28990/MAE_18760-like HEPN
MSSVLFQDFNERAKEVSQYFVLLKNLEQESIKLSMEGRGGNIKIKEITPDLLRTLKASGFLLIYNLVEATMRNAIESIFDDLRNNRVSYDEIRPELKKIVFKNLKKRSYDDIHLSIQAISVDIIDASFDREDLFSGNIDGRKIKATAIEYGFSYTTNARNTGNGADLLNVKTNRNALAHGFKSFAEVGRDKTADELLEIKSRVVKYLREILQNIDLYLTNKEYLDSASSKNSST